MQTTRFTRLYNPLKRRLLGHPRLARTILIILFVIIGLAVIFFTRPYLGLISSFFTPVEYQFSNSIGRTNFAILGIGGPGHSAPDLTDTIIFASVKLSTGQITLLSLPRDIWVPSLRAKINTAFHYGQQRQPDGGGLVLAKSAVAEIIDQPVHYALILDFSTFVQLVDLLGGLDIVVDNSFTDNLYPIAGREEDTCGSTDPQYLCRYETIFFEQGMSHMDGSTALKYVRSRHSSTNAEGTDFARSHRQVQVLKALQVKLLSLAKNPRNFSTLRSAYNLVTSRLITDFPSNNPAVFVKLAFLARKRDLQTFSLSTPDTLYHPPISSAQDGQWVLLPKDNNPQIVFDFVKGLLD